MKLSFSENRVSSVAEWKAKCSEFARTLLVLPRTGAKTTEQRTMTTEDVMEHLTDRTRYTHTKETRNNESQEFYSGGANEENLPPAHGCHVQIVREVGKIILDES